jgi:hypothetical protein
VHAHDVLLAISVNAGNECAERTLLPGRRVGDRYGHCRRRSATPGKRELVALGVVEQQMVTVFRHAARHREMLAEYERKDNPACTVMIW